MNNEKPSDGLWDTIPRHYENDILESIKELNIKITVQEINIFPNYLLTSRTTVTYRIFIY